MVQQRTVAIDLEGCCVVIEIPEAAGEIEKVSDLVWYLDQIVEQTFEDFQRNPTSVRHAFLACVAIYHAIDRAAEESGMSRGNLRKQWREKSFEFLMVDMVAHHFKHIKSDIEKAPTLPGHIPLSFLVFGRTGDKTVNEAGEQMELRNFFFIARDAVKFLHNETANIKRSALSAP
jgi:hypothetical protein